MTKEKLLKIIQVVKVDRRTTLKLGNSKIKELPPEIGSLTCLMDIDMSGNELECLPAKIKNLKETWTRVR